MSTAAAESRAEAAKSARRPRIVVTDHNFPSLPAVTAVAARTGAEFVVHQASKAVDVAKVAAGADVLLVQYAVVDRNVIQGLRTGATVIRYGIGLDNIDDRTARELGVRVCNVPDYGVDVVADHACAMILTQSRRLPWYDRQVRLHGWIDAAAAGPLPALQASTIGLLGGGRIALAVIDRLRAFGARVVVSDPHVNPAVIEARGATLVGLTELFRVSDVVSLHVPLTAETHRIVNASTLRLMAPHATLVNTARGELVDTPALIDALDRGAIAGAALDVFEHEPLDPSARVTTHPGIMHSPHAAFYSTQSLAALERLAAEEAERAILGLPLRCELQHP